MKKIVVLLFVVVLLIPTFASSEPTPTAAPYAFLDGMSLQELQALQDEVASRISIAKANEEASNQDNLGMWELSYYIDEFGEPTDQAFIKNINWIRGKFSNSATEGSALNVLFLIDLDDVALKLFEYAGNNPVKVFSETTYDVSIQDSNGIKHTCKAKEYSDRLYLPRDVLDIMGQNGKISFFISETGDYANSTYKFTIDDTSYIGNAVALLSK